VKTPPVLQHLGKNLVVALSLLVAGFFAAWLRYQPHLGSSGAYTDGLRHYDSFAGEPIRFAVWGTPEPLSGATNSAEDEHRPTLSPDGRWLVFATGERGQNAELWIVEMVAGLAESPRPLYELNTGFDELAPAFGQGALYFASNRPGGPGGFDLWRASFDGEHFECPVVLDASLNSTQDELDPAPLPGGAALAFVSNRDRAGRRGHDLYLARPSSADAFEVERLERLSSHADEREPAFTADGRRIFFASDRDAQAGSFDLFVSLYEGGTWLEPQPLPGLNGPASERGPAPSADGFELLFELEPRGAQNPAPSADIFRARSLEIFQRPGPRIGWLDLLILASLLVLALLAWLAKRWESIEVLYKCFLVSLMVHAALLYWFRDIHPEAGLASLEPSGPTYAVRLAAASADPARLAERGGELKATADDVTRRPVALTRAALRTPPAEAVAQPATAHLQREPAPRTALPERAASQLAVAPLPGAPVALADAAPRTRLDLGPAPTPALDVPAAVAPGRALAGAPQLERSAALGASRPAPFPRIEPSARAAREEEPPDPLEPSAERLAGRGPAPARSAPVAESSLRLPTDFAGPGQIADGQADLTLADLAPLAEAPTRLRPRPSAVGRRLDALVRPLDSPTPLPLPPATLRAPESRISAVDVPIAAGPFEHTPYRTRFGPAKARALEEHGGSSRTEAAVAAGLAYLAGIQHEVGFWGDARRVDDKYGAVFVGKTGLCMLAFLGAGHTQQSGSEYSEVVARATNFLLGLQRPGSGHFGRTSAYSHGIATYALAECFALTRDERLRAPLERAVAQILRHQNTRRGDPRRFGGWGYYYDEPGRSFDSWPRVSISAWQVMALESARLSGIAVPEGAFDDARGFLLGALDERRGRFRYSHDPERLRGAYPTLPGSTPAALFALSLLGEDLEEDRFAGAWGFLAEHAPGEYRYAGDEAFIERAQGNLYFWYYGSLACMRRGGGAWRRWNTRLQAALLESQRSDGSWQAISTYARDYAADRDDDASYSTAMNVLSLEVYYRYFTPLLRVSSPAPNGRAR
jgi:hypothetical protein